MDSIDKLSYKNLIGRKGLPQIPDLNGMTTATIEDYYSWLGITWDKASNTSLANGTPYFRTYTSLEREDLVDIEEIDLGYVDPDLEGRLFYRVTHPFYEKTYTSSADFYRWQYEKYRYLHEILYHNRVSSTIRWDRPSTGGGEGEDASPLIYLPLPEVLELTIIPNRAWGIELESDMEFSTTLSPQLTTNIKLSPLLVNEVVVRFEGITNPPPTPIGEVPTPYPVTPTYLKVDLYGEDLARHFYHVGGELEENKETLIHRVGTPFVERLLPPGLPNLEREFWNYRSTKPPILEAYYERRGREASIS